ncbi:ATP-binding cassette domain-containing protein [Litorimonas sp. WD9-15]|uniref:ATP-binding cassette domain-containing protein n=1 Tax=Litorimonas sp. WD9-15 TaxID=3418716 RepID=UPI003D062F20
MLDLNNIGQRYGKKQVLSDLTHRFESGVSVITGPSGVGKTTLLRLCASAERPSQGEVRWCGEVLSRTPRAFRAGLGYAPQRIDFPEDITGMDFLLHMAALKKIGLREAKSQGRALLDRLGLGRDADGRIRTYSGGMRRRLGLAQAFLGAPDILILDEPTAELDPQTAGHVNDLIFEKDAIVLMTTHLAESLSGRSFATLNIPMAQAD